MYATNSTHSSRGDEPLVVLGEVRFRNRTARFGLLPSDRLRHLWIIGKTGSGKSTLLSRLLAQDLQAGEGLALLDPHGDLVAQTLALVPRERTNDVLLLSPADALHPVAFNVFRLGRRLHPDPALLTSELVGVFRAQWERSWGPRLEHVLRNAILATASDPRATLLFLYRFLSDSALRDTVVERAPDPVVRQFWKKEFPGYAKSFQGEAMSPVLNKLGAFVANPKVRLIVSQEGSRVDLGRLMGERGILLADLAAGAIGADAAHLLGGLLLSALHQAAMYRPRGGPVFHIYLDEFQHFVTEDLPVMLAESRKFGLSLVLAHQYLDQLPVGLQAALRGNVGTRVVFRLGGTDALTLSPDFAPVLTAQDLGELRRYQAAVRMLARGEELSPFTAWMLPPVPPPSDALERIEAITRASRNRYASPVAGVEEQIKAMLRDV